MNRGGIPNPDKYLTLRLDRERAGCVENPRRSGATTAVLRLASTPALSPVYVNYLSGFGMNTHILRRHWYLLLVLAGALVWLLPASEPMRIGTVERSTPAAETPIESGALAWPQIRMEPANPQPGEPATIWVSDVQPWPHMRLTVDGRPARYQPPPRLVPADMGPPFVPEHWVWKWDITADSMPAQVDFYHDCHIGCVLRGQQHVGVASDAEGATVPTSGRQDPLRPTKLGLVFPHPERDWHARAGWAVELSYAATPDEAYWGIEDLAARVHGHEEAGLRVLLRLDYDRGQSMPPPGNLIAYQSYAEYLSRIAADARFDGLHAVFLGSGYNATDTNRLSPEQPVSPEWYVEMLLGSVPGSEGLSEEDDQLLSIGLVGIVRAIDPELAILIGPLRPFTLTAPNAMSGQSAPQKGGRLGAAMRRHGSTISMPYWQQWRCGWRNAVRLAWRSTYPLVLRCMCRAGRSSARSR